MNLRRIQYHCSCGSCDECTGGNALSYFEGMTQVPNIEQIVPIPGPAGEGSVLTAGKTSSAGVLNADGADEALDATAKANLLAADFDITAKSTTQNVVDASDLNNNKIWTGLSKGFLNMIGLKILPARVKTGGTAGQVYTKSSGTDYDAAWATQTGEVYNSVTTTSQAFNETTPSLIDDEIPFTVGTGYSYRFKNVVAIVDTVAPLSNYIEGIVVSYSAGVLTVKIKNIKGSGNTNNYNVMLTAPEYLPFIKDPANYGKFFYNNSGVVEMRTSIESVGDTKITLRPPALDPTGWLGFDGVPRSKTEYPALYDYLNYISSTFISGDNFILPNLAGRALVGVDGGAEWPFIGSIYGEKTHVLSVPEMPSHSHDFTKSSVDSPILKVPEYFPSGENDRGASASIFSIDTNSDISIKSTGGGLAHNNIQPSLAVRVIIKAK